MTKKSMARVQRDNEQREVDDKLKTNTCWDDLTGIYANVRELLIRHTAIASFKDRVEIHNFLRDRNSTIQHISILANDLLALNQQLSNVHQKHVNKKGGAKTLDEMMESYGIANEYLELSSKHDTVVMPVVMKILEDFDFAEKAYANSLNEANSNVVVESNESIPSTIDLDVTENNITDVEVINQPQDSEQPNV